MFDIGAVAGDRRDLCRFDDLLAKSIVHHVIAASGCDVPIRDIALAPMTEMNRWARPVEISTEVRFWLEKRLREMSRGRGGAVARVIAKAIGAEAPMELSVADIFDIAA
jgi:hypothetical protein